MVEIEEVPEAPAAAAPPGDPTDPAAAGSETEAGAARATEGEAAAAPEAAKEDEEAPGEDLPDPEELRKIEESRMIELIETAEEEISGLKQENSELQRRVWTMQKKRRSINAEQFILDGQEAFYRARLNGWSETKNEFERLKEEYDKKIDNLREMLHNKQNEARDRHEGMIEYMWQVARESADSISGVKIPERVLCAMQQEERDTIVEMQAVRIRGRQLRSQLKKLEHALELKDQLPGGLHLVDFEQLKMENESLNEKIHLKNEALSNLRKKTSNLVHTLTHVREKLQFVVQETKANGEALAADDKVLHEGRIELCDIKAACEAIKRKKENIQKNVVNISAPILLDDMEYQREDIETIEEDLQKLKARYHELMAQIKDKLKLSPGGSQA